MKTKKLIISLLIASPLMLTACPGNDKNTRGNNGGVVEPQPGGEQGKDPFEQPSAFFRSLEYSEDLLEQNYLFKSHINGGDVVYTDLGKLNRRGLTTFQELSRIQNRSVRSVKISFYNDIYAFSKNYVNLKLRETELKAYSIELYNEYISKTFALGNIYTLKRARLYSRSLNNKEKQLSKIGVQNINVINRGVLDINLIGADTKKLIRFSQQAVVRLILSTKMACDSIENMLNDPTFGSGLEGKNIQTCSNRPILLATSALEDADSMSSREIARSFNMLSIDRLNKLNLVADSYLAENSIVLNVGRPNGIKIKIRRDWERLIAEQNPNVDKRRLKKALNNNLYDNTLFKKNILETLMLLDTNLKRNQKTVNELKATGKAISGLRYKNMNLYLGTSAVVNGAGEPKDQPSVNFNDDVDTDLDDDLEIDDLDEDILDPKPRNSKEEEKKEESEDPPKPPTSIRRS